MFMEVYNVKKCVTKLCSSRHLFVMKTLTTLINDYLSNGIDDTGYVY